MPEMTSITAEALTTAMAAPLRRGQTADLQNRHVTGAVDLANRSIGHIDLSGSVFEAPFECRGATFGGQAWFKGCRFLRGCDVSASVFESDSRFDQSHFLAAATFERCEFRGVAAFDGAQFYGALCLNRMSASGSVSFAGAHFGARLSARFMDCGGGLWLEHAEFCDGFDFEGADVHGRTWLRGVHGGRGDGAALERAIAMRLGRFGYVYR